MEPKPLNKKILRRMKYLSDQRGIMNRYLSEGENWDPHLQQTMDFIVHCMGKIHFGSVAVLGSGWLLDLPLEFIAGISKEVYLFDVFHTPQILKKVAKYENVRTISADITGGAIEGVFSFVKAFRSNHSGSILDISFQASMTGIRPDYVISLNILNQLDILLIDYLKQNIEITMTEELEFRKRIQSQHLSLLKPGKSCLVTDSAERVINREGEMISEKTLIHCKLPQGQRRAEWNWKFDSRGEYNPRHRTEMQVMAIQF